MNVFIEYLKDLKEDGQLGDCVGTFLLCLANCITVIVLSAIFG